MEENKVKPSAGLQAKRPPGGRGQTVMGAALDPRQVGGPYPTQTQALAKFG